jgi:hypothetical protein
MVKNFSHWALLALLLGQCAGERDVSTSFDVVVLGGGTGGVAAGIQAARLGARTLIVEPTPWLGGMLTAAGVSAIDGNHAMPAGIWGEFRQKLRDHYGGAEALSTGWVSHTLFEPHVGARILDEMTAREPMLSVWRPARWRAIRRQGAGWDLEVENNGDVALVRAKILIDGTDLGDVTAAAGAAYDLGMDSRNATGEAMAPAQANDIVQDLTYVAILKDYGLGARRVIERPPGYDPDLFFCACRERCDGSYDLPCERMLEYGRLPNGKFMINWPNAGNDYYVNLVEMDEAGRAAALDSAKLHTLRFVYFIQHELGFAHLGLADDEYATPDSLPYLPYHREGRRVRGLARLDVNHLLEPFRPEEPLFRAGIAVGDYPIDHHLKRNPAAPEIDFPPVPSFNVPAGCLIPESVEGLLIADKAISVTNIVNGSTRLQPVILQIGQAAGALAALAVKRGTRPREVDVRELQDTILAAGGYLMPYYDAPPTHPHFQSIQRAGAAGLLRGVGEPYQWANRTWFYPDSVAQTSEVLAGLDALSPGFAQRVEATDGSVLDVERAARLAFEFRAATAAGMATLPSEWEAFKDYLIDHWTEELGLSDLRWERPLARAEWAVIADRLLQLFHWKKVDWNGRYK